MEMTSSSTNKTSSTAETTSPETITTSLEMTSSSIETTSPTAGCCTIGTMHLNLSTSTNSALIPGIMIETESTGTSSNCDVPVVVRATFERIGGQGGCRTCSLCKRTMLQVDLYLSDSRGGFLFNVGDSITNNGYGGDGGTQTNDAEVQGTGQGPSVKWYGNDYCQPTGVSGSLAMSTKNRLRLLIGNQFVRVITDGMTVNEACDRCLFALNGQAEVEGAVNEDVYVAFNKVVQKYSGRTGYGVCGADLSWVCGCLP
ncbi:uncharacterized protein LOC110466015 [Mizuhopecten yessoensis]|nr:uncharacterized protein LOC110466015 [Mizuhopecten yessoensis]